MDVTAGTVFLKGLQGGVSSGDIDLPGDGTTKTTKGKGTKGTGRRVSRIGSRIPGVGRLGNIFGGVGSRLTGIFGGLGSKLGGGVGSLGGLAAGAARFAGPIGLAITAATAGYGAY